MQFYGQDTIASKSSDTAAPFDFQNDPDGPNKGRNNLPVASNFFFYHKIGNVAFIGYSGGHSYESQIGFFDEACTWATSTNPSSVVLLNHWNDAGYFKISKYNCNVNLLNLCIST